MHNVFAIDDNLIKRGFTIVSCSSLCGNNYETAHHLFFNVYILLDIGIGCLLCWGCILIYLALPILCQVLIEVGAQSL